MSYSRCSVNSDVYVIRNVYDNFEIQICYNVKKELAGKYYAMSTHQNCLDKLLELRELGYKILDRALTRLENFVNLGIKYLIEL